MDDLVHFSFNEKSSVLLIFFFNALFIGTLLMIKDHGENSKQRNWLVSFILLGALYICPFMLGYAGWYGIKAYREFLFFIPFQQLLLIGPVFYFYVRTLLNRKFRLRKKDIIHFLPAILYAFYILVVFIVDKILLDTFYFYADGKDMDLDFWYQMAGLISMMFYLTRSYQFYISYRRAAVQEVSFADAISFNWIKHFALVFALILILRVLFFILNPEWGEFGSKYWYYLCFSVLLMYISIAGYTHTIKSSFHLSMPAAFDFEEKEKTDEFNIESHAQRDASLYKWKEKIDHLFEVEKIHTHSNLTLSELAVILKTNRNVISKTINQEYDLNFNDLVNAKRARAVIEKLKKGEHAQNTLLAIALDCGFNSKTTFNRAFKKHTGLSPKQYILKNHF
ncbi:MAG: AraC family transcriptional regulator [Bacteroidota bacterium]